MKISLIILFMFLSFGCKSQSQIPMYLEVSSENKSDSANKQFVLYFEQFFDDSVTVIYDKKIIFNDYVKTIKRFAAAKEYCLIDSIKKNESVYIKIGVKDYVFKPIQGYQYYFFNKGKYVGITYSNLSREGFH